MSQNTACNDTASILINLQLPPIADFTYQVNPCNQSVQFANTSNSNGVAASYIWSFGDGTFDTTFSPSHAYTNSGIDTVRLIVSANGCNDTIDKAISIIKASAGAVGDTLVCSSNNTVTIYAYGGSGYTWNPSGSFADTHAATQSFQPTSSAAYTVTITVSQSGSAICYVIDTVNVYLSNSGVNNIQATSDKYIIVQGESVVLHADPDSLLYNWSPSSGLSIYNTADVTATPIASTTYTVNATDRYGCSAMDTVYVKVLRTSCEEQDFFIPNTFTPNGDNVNDIFRVRGDIKELYFAVYDRWGEKVFETTDPKAGWDGTYKGMKVDPAVFAYYARIGCYSNKELFKKGNVTLIR
jgi:gliding motility-associated-like protein